MILSSLSRPLTALLVLGSVFSGVQAQIEAGAKYTITLPRGKADGCSPLNNMLSNQGCGKTVQDLFNKDDGSGNQHCTFEPVAGMDNTYNIKTNCGGFLSVQTCSGTTKTDIFNKDDASGRQRWTLVPVNGQANTYNIKVAGGREEKCGVFLSVSQLCKDNYVDMWLNDDGSGRQRWLINKVEEPPSNPTATTTQTPTATSIPNDGPPVKLDSSLFYTVTLAGGKVDCNPLNNMFSNQGCDKTTHDLFKQDDGSKNQWWRFVAVPSTENVFNIISACGQYLSVQQCGGSNSTDLFGKDDASGRQRWILTPISGATDTYSIRVAGGRPASDTCGTYISAFPVCDNNKLDLWTKDDGSGRQQWVLKTVASGDGKLPLAPLKFNPLPLGAVKPSADSWLLSQVQAQADGLFGHLHELSTWDVIKSSNWIGGKGDYSELNEAGSYWLNGLVPTAFQLNDSRLLSAVETWVDYIISHQADDGWLGPTTDGQKILWGRYPAALALMQYAQAKPDASDKVVSALQKFFLGMNDMLKNGGAGLEAWGIMRWQDAAITVHWLIENHPNGQEDNYSNLLRLLRYSGANWKQVFTDTSFPKAAINGVDIKGHGVNIGQAIKSEAVAYRFSHDDSDLDSTRKRIDLIEKYHGTVSGVLAADEHLAGSHPSRGAELCTVVEQMYSLEYVYTVTGDNAFADKVERLAYNALPGTFIEDMWGHQYLQQSNQPWAKSMEPRVFVTDGPDSNVFGQKPNYPCCTVNHGQGWPKFVSHAYMTSSDNYILHHVLLSPATVSTTLAGNNAVTVAAKTNYPFNTVIEYTTKSQKDFKFAVRVPTWISGSASSTLDGATQTENPDKSGYIILNVPAGDHTISVTLPMSIRTEDRFNSAKAVYRGPLAYSLDIGFSQKVLKDYELKSKDWQLDPTGNWQVALDPTTLKWNGDVNSTNLNTASVWAQSPVSMNVNTCPISWKVVSNAADAPPSSPAVCTGAENGARLIPYGAAKLRMSELPSFHSEPGTTGLSGGGKGKGGAAGIQVPLLLSAMAMLAVLVSA